MIKIAGTCRLPLAWFSLQMSFIIQFELSFLNGSGVSRGFVLPFVFNYADNGSLLKCMRLPVRY